MLIYVTHIHKVNCVFSLLKYGNHVLDPDQRMKVVDDCAYSLEIKNDIRPSRYFRSSLKIVRMADEYLDEGRLEKAYILCRRFMTCFKKLHHHPDFASVSFSDRALNNQKLREVVPKTEKLKTRLLEQYTREYKQHCEEHQKLKEKRRLMLRDKEDKRKKDNKFKITPLTSPEEKGKTMPRTSSVVMPPVTTDNIRNVDVLETEKSSYIPKPYGPQCLRQVRQSILKMSYWKL